MATTALPVTLDRTSGKLEFASVLAADGGNGDGQGRGKGNGKGRGDENGGGSGGGNGGGPNGDGLGNLGGGDGGDRDEAGYDESIVDPGQDIADDTVEPTGVADDAIAGTPAAALPTIGQIFALGDDAVLTADQELLAIKNGWNLPN